MAMLVSDCQKTLGRFAVGQFGQTKALHSAYWPRLNPALKWPSSFAPIGHKRIASTGRFMLLQSKLVSLKPSLSKKGERKAADGKSLSNLSTARPQGLFRRAAAALLFFCPSPNCQPAAAKTHSTAICTLFPISSVSHHKLPPAAAVGWPLIANWRCPNTHSR